MTLSMRVRNTIENIKASLWFVPSAFVAGTIVLSFFLLQVDWVLAAQASTVIPYIFSGTADAARNLLSSIAGSLITVVSIAFSLTMLAMQQASSQFSPRVLRNFMADRSSQIVLGAYTGTFVYALLVLRAVRNPSDSLDAGFVPAVSVTVAIFLVMFCLGLLIYFIHHIGRSLQISVIMSRIHSEMVEQLDRLYPQMLGMDQEETPPPIQELAARLERDGEPVLIRSKDTGFLRRIDEGALERAPTHGIEWIWLQPTIGDFVPHGAVLAELDKRGEDHEALEKAIQTAFVISSQRSIHQDALFGVRQLVDIALRALSPGINDPTTAEYSLFYLTDFLGRLAERDFPNPLRRTDAGTKVLANRPSWDDYIDAAFGQIRREAASDAHVTRILLQMLEELGSRVSKTHRAEAIGRQLAEIRKALSQQDYSLADRTEIDNYAGRVEYVLRTGRRVLNGGRAPQEA